VRHVFFLLLIAGSLTLWPSGATAEPLVPTGASIAFRQPPSASPAMVMRSLAGMVRQSYALVPGIAGELPPGALPIGLSQGAQGQAYEWSTVTVDAAGVVAWNGTSIGMDAKGDPVISYWDETSEDLKFATCDLPASANGNCDQSGDWATVTVDAAGEVGHNPSIAVGTSGNPMVSYYDWTNQDLKFATCDQSASANGNCDQSDDWATVTVDAEGIVGWTTSMALDANGHPVICYQDVTNEDLKFATCDLPASANGNCDQSGDWATLTVDAAGEVGHNPSMAVDTSGNLMVSYYDSTNEDLKFAVCDLSASVNGNCDQGGDWSVATVDAVGVVGRFSSVAVDSNGDPSISYWDQTDGDLRVAVCDASESANGNCDQTGDWSTVTVDALGDVGQFTSIAVDSEGNPLISYHDSTNRDLKFAICELSASANGNCDQTGDWSVETVDLVGDVGRFTSIAVVTDGKPAISYHDLTNADLKVAIGSPSPSLSPIGGVADVPEAAGDSGPSAGVYALLAALTAAALLALTAGVAYARRRRGG
jgi:hypothetical protein